MEHASQRYYIPHGTNWPIVGSIGLVLMLGGAAIMRTVLQGRLGNRPRVRWCCW